MRLNSFVVSVLALAGMQPERGSATFDLAGYLAELDRVRSALSTASTPDDARPIAAALPDRMWVAVDAQVIVVDTHWIDEAVDASVSDRGKWPAVRERLRQRLAAMSTSASEAALTHERPVRDVLHGILARPEFKREMSSQWLERLRKQVGNGLLHILNRILPSGATGHMAAVVFAWIVSIGAFIAGALWLVTVLSRRSDAAWLDLGAAAPPRTPARHWALRALDAARAGDLREAVRCAYNASVSKLEEDGDWSVDESRTPREYLALLQRDDPRYSSLSDVTRQFEQVWYGRRTATVEDADRLSAHLEHLGCLHGSERAIGRS